MKHNYISNDKEIVEKEKKHLNTTFYTAHVLHTYAKTPYSDSLQICKTLLPSCKGIQTYQTK